MLFLRKIMSAWLALALCGAPQLLRAQQTGNETQSAQPSPATNAPAPQQAAPPPAANGKSVLAKATARVPINLRAAKFINYSMSAMPIIG